VRALCWRGPADAAESEAADAHIDAETERGYWQPVNGDRNDETNWVSRVEEKADCNNRPDSRIGNLYAANAYRFRKVIEYGLSPSVRAVPSSPVALLTAKLA